ncbi:MAG: hypothetical protein HC836_47490 [Richelia sp. RM2_1_2]|nr:hypothetical protein [Richelia sp. RM2_1_2]
MDELVNKVISFEKVTTKLSVLRTLLTEQEPNYGINILSSYEKITVDDEICLLTINLMIKKYTKVRKILLKELKEEIRKLK